MTSRGGPALAEEGRNRDPERLCERGGSVGRDLGHPGFDAPHLESRRAEFIGKALPAPSLCLANLLDSPGNERTIGSHSNSVSETETRSKTFQTQTRNYALPLRPPVADLLAPDMELLERWAQQQGVKWEKVLKEADVTDPRDGSRASKSRMARGGAPRVRKKLIETLTKFELARSTPTEIGSLFVAYDDWKRLGAELAALDAERFKALLVGLRREVEAKRAQVESPFFDIK